MRVLALDAATEGCSVALLCNGEVTAKSIEAGRSHAQDILLMVEELLASGQVSLSMLDGIAASIGPGAFTGVRISVAVAQGLAFGADLGVVPITTLEALALQVLEGDAVQALACLDARMGEVYWACYRADASRGLTPTSAPALSAPESVTLPGETGEFGPGTRGIGRGFSAYPVLRALAGLKLDPDNCRALPNAREMARLGALRLARGAGIDPAELQPLYLRDKVALTEAERGIR
jgi:tRNA threonylcarbamoyladenosine biosynthesis protein TsaB